MILNQVQERSVLQSSLKEEAGDPIPEDVHNFTTNNTCSVPSQGRIVPSCSLLLDGGEHFVDVPRYERRDRRDTRRRSTNEPLPT